MRSDSVSVERKDQQRPPTGSLFVERKFVLINTVLWTKNASFYIYIYIFFSDHIPAQHVSRFNHYFTDALRTSPSASRSRDLTTLDHWRRKQRIGWRKDLVEKSRSKMVKYWNENWCITITNLIRRILYISTIPQSILSNKGFKRIPRISKNN